MMPTGPDESPQTMLSIPHMIVVFVIVLVVFGPQKLPELARGLGKLMAEFRKASTDFKSAFEEEMRDLERQAREVERKKQALQASAAARLEAPATLASPSGAETPAATSETAESAGETRATEGGELVATPVPESVARETEAIDDGSNGGPHTADSSATPETPAEAQLNATHDHQQPA
jgi:sec-independent protein translocase protein TatB